MITVLITGVGAPLGQALIKSARHSRISCRVVGTDRCDLSVGLRWVDTAHVIPDASDADAYMESLLALCESERVHLVLPGSESELQLLAERASTLRERCGTVVVASSPGVLRIGLDKWQTVNFLKAIERNVPDSAMLDDAENVNRLIDTFGFPLIAKPCRGSGSQYLFKVRSRADISYALGLGKEMILQEYLLPDSQEYTIAAYTLRDGSQAGSISLKRELFAGNTYRAWVSHDRVVQAEAEAVVKALCPLGPCNVQLRLTERGPVTFEINPRFSGTTAMRAHFGFNEVEMAIQDLVLNQTIPEPQIKPGVALRFWEEIFLDEKNGVPVALPA